MNYPNLEKLYLIEMPICHDYKFVFVHIPKACGSSIEKKFNLYGINNKGKNNILCKNIMFGRNYQHLTYEQILNTSPRDVSNYFSFSFVRNPWSKMVSEFFWRKPFDKEIYGFTFNQFVDRVCDFDLNHPDMCPHFIEQSRFILNKKNQSVVDFIGKTENLALDFKIICKKIGFDNFNLKKINKTNHKHYSFYYNKQSIKKVKQKYHRDIECFDYEFQG